MLLASLFFTMPFLALFGVFALLAPSWSWMVALIGIVLGILGAIWAYRWMIPPPAGADGFGEAYLTLITNGAILAATVILIGREWLANRPSNSNS
jgi:hypothetical protein